MKLIEELKKEEEYYTKIHASGWQRVIFHTEAKQIIKMYELLEEVYSFIDSTPDTETIENWCKEFEELKKE